MLISEIEMVELGSYGTVGNVGGEGESLWLIVKTIPPSSCRLDFAACYCIRIRWSMFSNLSIRST